MNRDASPAANGAANGAANSSPSGRPIDSREAHTGGTTPTRQATRTRTRTPTPKKKTGPTTLDGCLTVTPPPRSVGIRRASSCKRRRLDSEDDNENTHEISPADSINIYGSARKLSYERNDSADSSDESEDEEEDPLDQELVRMRQESILRKIQRLKYEDGEDQLMHATAFTKIFEYVKGYDVVAIAKSGKTWASADNDKNENDKGVWKYRGSGYVKFVKCLEEGYNCGMIRQELTKNGTLDMLMRHELTHEEVEPMPSKKGKAYTWISKKDWAYGITACRTFAIRFDSDMEALKWKTQLEQSKTNNCRVRRGLDIPDVSAAVEDVCSSFGNLSTNTAACYTTSPKRAKSGN